MAIKTDQEALEAETAAPQASFNTQSQSSYSEESPLTVLVVGYPKSGNTWTSRLVAEALGCPVGGFWRQGSLGWDAVGLERNSPHVVFKSHHPADQVLAPMAGHKVLHVVRDPRDVACSGASFFPLGRFHSTQPERAYADGHEAMVCALVEGATGYSLPAWFAYNQGFVDQGVHLIRYEDLLVDPLKELLRIMAYLGVERDRDRLLKAIEKQSFSSVKQRAKLTEDHTFNHLLRQGKAGCYRQELSIALRSRVEHACGALMQGYGYPLDFPEDPEIIAALDSLQVVPSPVPLRRVGSAPEAYCLIPEDLDGLSHWLATPCSQPEDSVRESLWDELRQLHGLQPTDVNPGQPCVLHLSSNGFRQELLAQARIVGLELPDLLPALEPEAFERQLAPALRALAESFRCVHLRCPRPGLSLNVPGLERPLPSCLQATFLRRERFGNAAAHLPPLLPHPLELVPAKGAHPQMLLHGGWSPAAQPTDASRLKELEFRISILRTPRVQVPRRPKSPRSVSTDLAHARRGDQALIAWLFQQCCNLSASGGECSPAEPPAESIEIAAGKPFRLKAAYGPFPEAGVVRAEAPFFFHTAMVSRPWITVDLQGEFLLHRLVLENRSDMCFERARFLFYVVHDRPTAPLEQGRPLQGIGEPFLRASPQPSATDLGGVRGRFLTLFSPDITALHFRDLRLYGTPVVGECPN